MRLRAGLGWILLTAPWLVLGVLISGHPLADPLASVGANISLQLVTASLFYFALRRGPRARRAWLPLLATGLLLTPLLLDHRVARAPAGLVAFILVLKLVDLHVGAGRGSVPGPWAVLGHLPNLLVLHLRRALRDRVPPAGETLRHLAREGAALLLSVALAFAVWRVDWGGQPFLLEHVVKSVAFFAAATAGFDVLARLLRLGGSPTRDFARRPLLAATPAEFWRRYNRIMTGFLHANVFRPLGGFRRPVRATMAVFLLSGLGHEYLFSMPDGRLQGYQTAFFLVQGVAVVATAKLRPRGWMRVPAVVATALFNLAAGLLFFASFHVLARNFYANPLPGWLVW